MSQGIGTFDGEVLRVQRYKLDPEHEKNSQHLEWVELVEIRWPDGENDIMERCHRKAGTWSAATPAGDHPEFWLRFAYQSWEYATPYLEGLERGHGTLLSVEPMDPATVDASRLGCGAYWGHGKPGDHWDSTSRSIFHTST